MRLSDEMKTKIIHQANWIKTAYASEVPKTFKKSI